LKVLIYAYSQRTFSSRMIAKALRENVNYMWLSGMSRPDHRTINRFRGQIMKEVVEEVFYGVIEQLLEMGYIDLERYFVDGTKVEANANRYSFVWRKSTEKYQANLQEKVRKLLEEIEELEAAERGTVRGRGSPRGGRRAGDRHRAAERRGEEDQRGVEKRTEEQEAEAGETCSGKGFHPATGEVRKLSGHISRKE